MDFTKAGCGMDDGIDPVFDLVLLQSYDNKWNWR